MSKKITVIVGTNRAESMSGKVAFQYSEILKTKGAEVEFYSLADLPHTIAFSELYGNRSEDFSQVIEKYVSSVEKFVFIIPEYNGGFPGVLKLFLDAVPPTEWANKKAGLIGVSSGRAGAARAMDQMTNVLNYLKVNVHFSKATLSGITKLMDDSHLVITDGITLGILDDHAEALLEF